MAKQIERAVKFLLTHHCYLPGAEGVIGETIELRRDVAEKLLANGGGRIIEPEVKPEPEGESHAA